MQIKRKIYIKVVIRYEWLINIKKCKPYNYKEKKNSIAIRVFFPHYRHLLAPIDTKGHLNIFA